MKADQIKKLHRLQVNGDTLEKFEAAIGPEILIENALDRARFFTAYFKVTGKLVYHPELIKAKIILSKRMRSHWPARLSMITRLVPEEVFMQKR